MPSDKKIWFIGIRYANPVEAEYEAYAEAVYQGLFDKGSD